MSSDKKHISAVGYIMALSGGILWAVGGICGQSIFNGYGATSNWLVPIRLSLAGIITLIIALVRGKNIIEVWKSPKTIWRILLFAIFGSAFCQYGYYTSIQYSNAAFATVMCYTSPVVILIWNIIRLRRRPWLYQVISVILVVAGAVICATHFDFTKLAVSPAAIFWGIVSSCCFAFYTLWPGMMLKGIDVMSLTGWGMLVGGVLLGIFCRPWSVPIAGADFKLVLLMAGVIILGTVLSFNLYQAGCMRIGGFAGSVLSAVEPVCSIILSVVILHTSFTFADILGFAMILSTIPLITVFDARKNRLQS